MNNQRTMSSQRSQFHLSVIHAVPHASEWDSVHAGDCEWTAFVFGTIAARRAATVQRRSTSVSAATVSGRRRLIRRMRSFLRMDGIILLIRRLGKYRMSSPFSHARLSRLETESHHRHCFFFGTRSCCMRCPACATTIERR